MNNNPQEKQQVDRQANYAWLYFALTLGWTWLFWVPAVLFGLASGEIATMVLHALGGIGPAVVGIGLAYREQGHPGWGKFWQRLFDYRRIRPGWYLFILLYYPAIKGLGLLLYLLSCGGPLDGGAVAAPFSQPFALFSSAIFVLLFGPLPEEIGWRGFALDRLQGKRTALASSLVVGMAWAIWHLPLFFIEGTYQNQLGPFSPRFWMFLIVLIPESVLYTWIFNNNRRSTLAAVLFHFMANYTGEILELPEGVVYFNILLTFLAAGLVVIAGGPLTLARPLSGFLAARPGNRGGDAPAGDGG